LLVSLVSANQFLGSVLTRTLTRLYGECVNITNRVSLAIADLACLRPPEVPALKYVKLQVLTTRCPSLTQGRRNSGPRRARHCGISRHLHFVAGASAVRAFARRLCRFGLIDPRRGSTPLTHDSGQTGISDQRWHWFGNPTAGPMRIVETTAARTAARKPSRSAELED
jgi:hypothetical protein